MEGQRREWYSLFFTVPIRPCLVDGQGHRKDVSEQVSPLDTEEPRKDTLTAARECATGTALRYCLEKQTPCHTEPPTEVCPALDSRPDEDGFSTLHYAIISGNRTMVRFLVDRGADIWCLDREKHSCVHWAVVCGEPECLEILLAAGADASTPDIHGAYPIHYAAETCVHNSERSSEVPSGLSMLRHLISFGVDVNVRDVEGRTPLHWAAGANNASNAAYHSAMNDAVLALVSAGADVSATDRHNMTALHYAASHGHAHCVETLISLCGAKVDALDSSGRTELFYAVSNGHVECVEILLKNAATAGLQDCMERTPPHWGAANGQLEVLKVLSKHGTDMCIKDNQGELPLHSAVRGGWKDVVLWLLDLQPFTVNAAASNGCTPLHVAAVMNNDELCRLLVSHGANVNAVSRDTKGHHMTPLDAATHKGHSDCGRCLRKLGAVPFSEVAGSNSVTAAHGLSARTGEAGGNGRVLETRGSSHSSEFPEDDTQQQLAKTVRTSVQREYKYVCHKGSLRASSTVHLGAWTVENATIHSNSCTVVRSEEETRNVLVCSSQTQSVSRADARSCTLKMVGRSPRGLPVEVNNSNKQSVANTQERNSGIIRNYDTLVSRTEKVSEKGFSRRIDRKQVYQRAAFLQNQSKIRNEDSVSGGTADIFLIVPCRGKSYSSSDQKTLEGRKPAEMAPRGRNGGVDTGAHCRPTAKGQARRKCSGQCSQRSSSSAKCHVGGPHQREKCNGVRNSIAENQGVSSYCRRHKGKASGIQLGSAPKKALNPGHDSLQDMPLNDAAGGNKETVAPMKGGSNSPAPQLDGRTCCNSAQPRDVKTVPHTGCQDNIRSNDRDADTDGSAIAALQGSTEVDFHGNQPEDRTLTGAPLEGTRGSARVMRAASRAGTACGECDISETVRPAEGATLPIDAGAADESSVAQRETIYKQESLPRQMLGSSTALCSEPVTVPDSHTNVACSSRVTLVDASCSPIQTPTKPVDVDQESAGSISKSCERCTPQTPLCLQDRVSTDARRSLPNKQNESAREVGRIAVTVEQTDSSKSSTGSLEEGKNPCHSLACPEPLQVKAGHWSAEPARTLPKIEVDVISERHQSRVQEAHCRRNCDGTATTLQIVGVDVGRDRATCVAEKYQVRKEETKITVHVHRERIAVSRAMTTTEHTAGRVAVPCQVSHLTRSLMSPCYVEGSKSGLVPYVSDKGVTVQTPCQGEQPDRMELRVRTAPETTVDGNSLTPGCGHHASVLQCNPCQQPWDVLVPVSMIQKQYSSEDKACIAEGSGEDVGQHSADVTFHLKGSNVSECTHSLPAILTFDVLVATAEHPDTSSASEIETGSHVITSSSARKVNTTDYKIDASCSPVGFDHGSLYPNRNDRSCDSRRCDPHLHAEGTEALLHRVDVGDKPVECNATTAKATPGKGTMQEELPVGASAQRDAAESPEIVKASTLMRNLSGDCLRTDDPADVSGLYMHAEDHVGGEEPMATEMSTGDPKVPAQKCGHILPSLNGTLCRCPTALLKEPGLRNVSVHDLASLGTRDDFSEAVLQSVMQLVIELEHPDLQRSKRGNKECIYDRLAHAGQAVLAMAAVGGRNADDDSSTKGSLMSYQASAHESNTGSEMSGQSSQGTPLEVQACRRSSVHQQLVTRFQNRKWRDVHLSRADSDVLVKRLVEKGETSLSEDGHSLVASSGASRMKSNDVSTSERTRKDTGRVSEARKRSQDTGRSTIGPGKAREGMLPPVLARKRPLPPVLPSPVNSVVTIIRGAPIFPTLNTSRYAQAAARALPDMASTVNNRGIPNDTDMTLMSTKTQTLLPVSRKKLNPLKVAPSTLVKGAEQTRRRAPPSAVHDNQASRLRIEQMRKLQQQEKQVKKKKRNKYFGCTWEPRLRWVALRNTTSQTATVTDGATFGSKEETLYRMVSDVEATRPTALTTRTVEAKSKGDHALGVAVEDEDSPPGEAESSSIMKSSRPADAEVPIAEAALGSGTTQSEDGFAQGATKAKPPFPFLKKDGGRRSLPRDLPLEKTMSTKPKEERKVLRLPIQPTECGFKEAASYSSALLPLWVPATDIWSHEEETESRLQRSEASGAAEG